MPEKKPTPKPTPVKDKKQEDKKNMDKKEVLKRLMPMPKDGIPGLKKKPPVAYKKLDKKALDSKALAKKKDGKK